MRADGRCDGCGCMIAKEYEVERIYHTACVPLVDREVLAKRLRKSALALHHRATTGYEGATPMENATIHRDVDFKGELPPCLEAVPGLEELLS